jgi:hypothetical protein
VRVTRYASKSFRRPSHCSSLKLGSLLIALSKDSSLSLVMLDSCTIILSARSNFEPWMMSQTRNLVYTWLDGYGTLGDNM